MKKKIAILGSTGSIGKSTLEIIKKDKKNFDVVLLSTNKNIRELSGGSASDCFQVLGSICNFNLNVNEH